MSLKKEGVCAFLFLMNVDAEYSLDTFAFFIHLESQTLSRLSLDVKVLVILLGSRIGFFSSRKKTQCSKKFPSHSIQALSFRLAS